MKSIRWLQCISLVLITSLAQTIFAQTTLYSDGFESGFGAWVNLSAGDNNNWLRNSGGTVSSGTGPVSAANGNYYLYLETSSGSAYYSGDSAILQSPAFVADGIHLTFYYHMYGANIGSLAVDVMSSGTWVLDVWRVSGQQQSIQTQSYQFIDLDLSAYAATQIRIRATAAGGYMGDIAIDELNIVSYPSGPVAPSFVQQPLVKPFAVSGQPYINSLSSDAIDANNDPIEFAKVSGPAWLNVAVDGSLSGSPTASDIGLNAFTISVSDGVLSDTGTVQVDVVDGAMPFLISSTDFEAGFGQWTNTSGDQFDWTRYSGSTPSSSTGPASGANSTYYVYIETSSGLAYQSGNAAMLLSPELPASDIQLRFNYHMYGSNTGSLAVDALVGGVWINAIWSVSGQQQGSVADAYGYAEIDLGSYSASQVRLRATSAGGYMGDIAVDNIEIWHSPPQAPQPPAFESATLLFPEAYFGADYSGSLAASASDPNGELLSFAKVSGPSWLSIAADGNLSGVPVSADAGTNVFEVSVTDGTFTAYATLEIVATENTAPVVLSFEGFEGGAYHYWFNTTLGDSHDWSLASGSTASSNTGPTGGASGSFNYVYLETSSGAAYYAGNSAILESPPLGGSSNIHFNFMYHMYGSNMGTLYVDVLQNGTWLNSVWSLSGQQQTSSGAGYNSVHVDLTPYQVTRIRLRMVAAGGFLGDVAVDNLEILAVNPQFADSDNDGVVDASDSCPGTPFAETADSNGCSASQRDSDGDTVKDDQDAFPFDPLEWADFDLDGIGDNTDLDDDGDGYPDTADAFPFDAQEWIDSDSDGLGNNSDPDDDGDGVVDSADAFPLDPLESVDTDGDGIGNNADNDDDNDGVMDSADAFPLDAGEVSDFDGDGLGDNTDTDDDNDGLSDTDESFYGTDPFNNDSDFDLMPDGWEIQNDLEPLLDDSGDDKDGDGYTNLEEFQLGLDPQIANLGPLETIDDLSLSTTSSCAIVAGQIQCWGNLGLNFSSAANIVAAQRVAHNSSVYCALHNNTVSCDGYQNSSLLTGLQANPIANATDLELAAIGNTACVITASGSVNCWGDNAYSVATPPNGIGQIQQVAMMQYHACARNGTSVECWGRNDSLQADVPTDLTSPLDITVGGLHSCALQADGRVRCWGNNDYSQLAVPADLGPVVDISSGYYHSCAVEVNGNVRCWGGTRTDALAVPSDLASATAITSGPYNNCANTTSGTRCWGQNDYGQSAIWYNVKDMTVGEDHVCAINDDEVMCLGTTINEPAVLVVPDNIVAPQVIGAGRYHSCLWADSGMHCWGKSTAHLNYPAGLSSVTQLQSAAYQTCALDNGQVVCWGDNVLGVLNVPSLNQPSAVAAANGHTCALDGNEVRCWGDNRYGQANPRFNLSNPRALAAGGMYPNTSDTGHTCVADDNGVQCWGSSALSVLAVPPGLSNVTQLFAGWGKNCALQQNGNVRCWGGYSTSEEEARLSTGNVEEIEGYSSTVCSRNNREIQCSSGRGALLMH